MNCDRRFARKAYLDEVERVTIQFNLRYIMTTRTKRQQVTFKIPKETNERLEALAIERPDGRKLLSWRRLFWLI